MRLIEFINSLNEADFTVGSIEAICRIFISDSTEENCKFNKKEFNNFFDKLKEEQFSELEWKLNKCKDYCNKEQQISEKVKVAEYSLKLKRTIDAIDKIIEVFKSKFHNKKESKTDHSYILEQHDAKLADINSSITSLNGKVREATKSIDDKMFTLLINTVAILGIFVAIAFTGFGITAIFPKIDISIALLTTENLIKTIFFLLLVSLICYNLLLLLVYFIFRLSRPLYINLRKEKDENGNDIDNLTENNFVGSINLIPFLVIDGALSLLTLFAFIFSL